MFIFQSVTKKLLALSFAITLLFSTFTINTNAYVLDGLGSNLLQCSVSGLVYQNSFNNCGQQNNYCGVNPFFSTNCSGYSNSFIYNSYPIVNPNQSICNNFSYLDQSCYNLNYDNCGNTTVSGSIEDVSFLPNKYDDGGKISLLAKVYTTCQFNLIPIALTVVENGNKEIIKTATNLSTFDQTCGNLTPKCYYLQANFDIPYSVGNNYKVYASFQNSSNYFDNSGYYSVRDNRKPTEFLLDPQSTLISCDINFCNYQNPCFNPSEITSFCY